MFVLIFLILRISIDLLCRSCLFFLSSNLFTLFSASFSRSALYSLVESVWMLISYTFHINEMSKNNKEHTMWDWLSSPNHFVTFCFSTSALFRILCKNNFYIFIYFLLLLLVFCFWISISRFKLDPNVYFICLFYSVSAEEKRVEELYS